MNYVRLVFSYFNVISVYLLDEDTVRMAFHLGKQRYDERRIRERIEGTREEHFRAQRNLLHQWYKYDYYFSKMRIKMNYI